jgi:membrane protein
MADAQRHLEVCGAGFFYCFAVAFALDILLTILAQIYGQNQAPQMLLAEISRVAGPTIADMINQLINNAANPFTSVGSSVINVAFALAGAVGAFAVLQDTLNVIWEVPRMKNRTLKSKVRGRTVSFLVVTIVGVIVMAWIGTTTAAFESLGFGLRNLFGTSEPFFTETVQICLSFCLLTGLFAVVYKQVPDTQVKWRDVGLAAVLTGAVSTALNYLFGSYVQTFSFTSAVGVGGSLLFLLLWIFASFQVVLYGAHFSKIYAEKSGSRSKMKKW